MEWIEVLSEWGDTKTNHQQGLISSFNSDIFFSKSTYLWIDLAALRHNKSSSLWGRHTQSVTRTNVSHNSKDISFYVFPIYMYIVNNS